MTVSRLISRIFLLLLAGGLLLSGTVRFDASRNATATKKRIRSAPAYLFQDVTGEAGMRDATRTWGSTWTDFDENGYPDLWIGRHWRQPRLFQAFGGTRFRETAAPDFELAQVDRHHCVWGEANGDGKADLYCVRGADRGKGKGANQLFLQTDSGSFDDRAEGRGVSNPYGRGRTANWLDFDSDGDLDIFVGNLTRPGYPNAMFRNDGEVFTEVDVGVAHELPTVSSSWADWDRDGDPDLLVLGDGDTPALAYENVGGAFQTVDIANVTDASWSSAAWGDLDGDGRPDLHLVSATRSVILRNTPNGFEVIDGRRLQRGQQSVWLDVDNDGDLDSFVLQGAPGRRPGKRRINHPDFLLVNTRAGFVKLQHPSIRGPRLGSGDAVSAADFDRDGRVDLFITNGIFYWTGPNALLRNVSAAGNWVGLDLDGDPGNPLGFGAVVTARLGRKTIIRQVNDGANFRAQDEAGYVHLGIGNRRRASIEVVWADGSRDCVEAVHGLVTSVVKGAFPCLKK